MDRGITFASQCRCRWLVHPYYVISVDDADIRCTRVASESVLYSVLLPHKKNLCTQLPGRQNCPRDWVFRRMISPHRVNCYFHRTAPDGQPAILELVLVGYNDGSSLVITTMRANTVGRLVSTAIRTFGTPRHREAIVRSPAIAAGTGMSFLR